MKSVAQLLTEILDVTIDKPIEDKREKGLKVSKQEVSVSAEKFKQVTFVELGKVVSWLKLKNFNIASIKTLEKKRLSTARRRLGAPTTNNAHDNENLYKIYEALQQKLKISMGDIIIYSKTSNTYATFFYPVPSDRDTIQVTLNSWSQTGIYDIQFISLKHGMGMANSGKALDTLKNVVLSVNFYDSKLSGGTNFYTFSGVPETKDKASFQSRRHSIYVKLLRKFLPAPAKKKIISFPDDDTGFNFSAVFMMREFTKKDLFEYLDKSGRMSSRIDILPVLTYVMRNHDMKITKEDLARIKDETGGLVSINSPEKIEKAIRQSVRQDLLTSKYREKIFAVIKNDIKEETNDMYSAFKETISYEDDEGVAVAKELVVFKNLLEGMTASFMTQVIVNKKIYKEGSKFKRHITIESIIEEVGDEFTILLGEHADEEPETIKSALRVNMMSSVKKTMSNESIDDIIVELREEIETETEDVKKGFEL